MKLLLLILIILTFSYLFYLLYERKQIFEFIKKQNKNNIDGMTTKEISDIQEQDNKNALVIINKNTIKKTTNIQNVEKSSISPNLHLHNLCIKGSYNTAYTGDATTSYGYINLEMLKYVLYRGCRYLDFQVFYILGKDNNEDLYVGFNNNVDDPTPLQVNQVNVKLYDILDTVIKNGFLDSSPSNKLGLQYSTPNMNDPLFIQIRIHPKSPNKKDLLNKIQNVIIDISNKSYYTNYFSKVEINKDTYLKDIMNKIIFVFEYEVDIYNQNRAFYTNYMENFSVIYLNNGYFRKKLYSDVDKTTNRIIPSKIVQIQDATGNTYPTVYTDDIKVVCPNNNGTTSRNINIFTSIVDYTNQINLLQYYVSDTSTLQLIKNSEDLFDSFGFSFVPIYNAMLYVDSIKR